VRRNFQLVARRIRTVTAAAVLSGSMIVSLGAATTSSGATTMRLAGASSFCKTLMSFSSVKHPFGEERRGLSQVGHYKPASVPEIGVGGTESFGEEGARRVGDHHAEPVQIGQRATVPEVDRRKSPAVEQRLQGIFHHGDVVCHQYFESLLSELSGPGHYVRGDQRIHRGTTLGT